MTCYDLRFPEVSRTLADAGVDVVLVPAEWVRGPLKEHHWRTLVQARAIENTVFVAGADHPPPLGVGHSMIVDPQGVIIATVGTTTDVAVAHIDPDAIARVRRVNPALELRRFRVTPR
jgi:predicted amidohydrolase